MYKKVLWKFNRAHSKDNELKKKMKLLAKEQQESCENCHYTGEFIGATHSICNLKYSVPKNIPADFHKGSNYDYLFIIKELAEYFENYLLV